MMTVRQLREWLASQPDNRMVMLPGPDHSYAHARASVANADRDGREFYEPVDPDHPEAEIVLIERTT